MLQATETHGPTLPIIRRFLRRCLWPLRTALLLLSVLTTACSTWHPSPPLSPQHDSLLDRFAPIVERELLGADSNPLTRLQQQNNLAPGQFKLTHATETFTHPLNGLKAIDQFSVRLAELAKDGPDNVSALLTLLDAGLDHPSQHVDTTPLPAPRNADAVLAAILSALQQAAVHRNNALAKLSEEDREFLFRHAATLVSHFTPQFSTMTPETMTLMKANLRFTHLVREYIDHSELLAAAHALSPLIQKSWGNHVLAALASSPPIRETIPGITGDILLLRQTDYGLVIIGGRGPNHYDLDDRFAMILDLGGDDHYRGMIGASSNPNQGNALVIDLSGNDRYTADRLGLATGRLGVGLLVDGAGNDVYELSEGSGGVGLAGLGILLDVAGHDVYKGSRLTQGAAIGGLGLAVDLTGDDTYSSHGYAIGFGGPLGIGALIDVQGNDTYGCGHTYASAYNAQDAPTAKPGDPSFQYDCFGLGAGSGSRILNSRADWRIYNLAGGWGLLIDRAGHDSYQSDNFSQGVGYFWGIGTKLDLDGDDLHLAARYGHGAAAHHGIALFMDRSGRDQYGSTGPFYNAGVAWDHSVSLAIDAGNSPDNYVFDRSTGLGRADHSSWAVFLDEGGQDHYITQSGFGSSSEDSMAGFFDLEGEDLYQVVPASTHPQSFQPSNAIAFRHEHRGVFFDR